jgi:hypothetical protein
LPFEARNADPDPEIRGPQDFYSEGHPKPDPGYAGDGYDPRNSPYSDPNETYDPNQPPAYGGPPYPEAESPPTASGPGPSGPGGPGGPTGPRGSGGPSGPGGPEGDFNMTNIPVWNGCRFSS